MKVNVFERGQSPGRSVQRRNRLSTGARSERLRGGAGVRDEGARVRLRLLDAREGWRCIKEGAAVKKDDVLFVVNTRPYQAQLDQAEGRVNRCQALLELAKATLARCEGLASSEPGAVSKQALDQYKAQVIEADAALQAAKASLEVYSLNLNFCKVTSPISGQVSRYYRTPGNLVNQDQTLLTTVLSLDPMYAYFDVDEATLLKVNQAIKDGNIVQVPERGATFAVMAVLGFSLNNVSLFGLVLAIGIVVDDAIVEVENIQRWLEQGLEPRRQRGRRWTR